MNITELKLKPKLIEITVDDESITTEYGEPITFWMYDHLDISTYFAFYKAQGAGNTDALLDIIRGVIRDSSGNIVLGDGDQLPVDIFASAITKISDQLGKSGTKNST